MDTNNLKKFLEEHFYYEVDKLCTSLAHIIIFHNDRDEIKKMLALECFLLHFRNLVEFLYFDRKKSDDARSKDYINDADWNQLKASYDEEMKKLYRRASKEINHLTYSRIDGTPPKKSWDCSNVFKKIEKDLKTFLNYLPEGYGEVKQIIEEPIVKINKYVFSHYIT